MADYRLVDWVVRPSLDRIERGDEVVHLQHLSMQVLCFLADRPGELVTYDELLGALWPGRVATEDAVHRRIADLRLRLGDDARSPRYIETILKQGYRIIAPVEPLEAPAREGPSRWLVAAAALTVVMLFGLLSLPEAPLPTDVIDTANAALDADEYELAYEIAAAYLDSHAEHPDIVSLKANLLTDVRLETDPPSTQVAVRRYGAAGGNWRELGTTPFEGRLPRGNWLVRLTAAGREAVELALPNPSRGFNNVGQPTWVFELPREATVPEGMVYVPPFESIVPILGLRRVEDLGPFYIGRTEVANADYQSFVSSGGYGNPAYWSELDQADPPLTMADVAERFVDTTGMPGPALWADGRFPDGQDRLPVTGISYFEAMAYASFRELKLPTARHWARAALGIDEHRWPLASALVPVAQLAASGPMPVDAGEALSTWGAHHMVGNVREWTRDYSGTDRLAVGASFLGPAWGYASAGFSDPLQRSAAHGMRLASYSDAVQPAGAIDWLPRVPDVSAETFAGILRQFEYPIGTIRAEDAELVYEREEGEWLRRRILLPTEDPEEPLPVLAFLPRQTSGPIKPIIFIPPGDSYDAGYPSERIDIAAYHIDFLVREGYALIWPIYYSSHERYRERPAQGTPEQIRFWHVALDRRRNEVGRVIDYLQSSPEFDGDDVSLLAISFGATVFASPFLATEERLRRAILLATGLASIEPDRVPLHLNPNTYWPHVTQPVLILSGRYDLGFNAGTSEPRILKTLGSVPDRKKVILYPTAHWPLPAGRLRRDVLAWLAELEAVPDG